MISKHVKSKTDIYDTTQTANCYHDSEYFYLQYGPALLGSQ